MKRFAQTKAYRRISLYNRAGQPQIFSRRKYGFCASSETFGVRRSRRLDCRNEVRQVRAITFLLAEVAVAGPVVHAILSPSAAFERQRYVRDQDSERD